ncbi:hypothetical protein TUM17580_40680 [Citrobacter farmeri]|nr:hypothetical protein TUM17580_40680 [Citrobacter farmeri]
MAGDGGRHWMPLRKFSGCNQTVYTRGTQFIGSVHDNSQKFVASTAEVPGSDGHNLKPIPADFKCEVDHTSRQNGMITKK